MTIGAHDLAIDSLDQCYRCGYDLRGVVDEQPCPECGLLAARSRRPTDELHHTRPGWLRRLSWGVKLIVLAMALAVAAPFVAEGVSEYFYVYTPRGLAPPAGFALLMHSMWFGADLAAFALLAGVVLITTPEGHPPADRQDAWRRLVLRLLSLAPILALLMQHFATQRSLTAVSRRSWLRPSFFDAHWGLLLPLSIIMAMLVVLLYLQLRSLAKRARSAHLAEHCVIVGVGNAVTLLYVPLFIWLMSRGAEGAFGDYWLERSRVSAALIAVLGVASMLFALWNLYLLTSFAVAFAQASRRLRSQWIQADRATGVGA